VWSCTAHLSAVGFCSIFDLLGLCFCWSLSESVSIDRLGESHADVASIGICCTSGHVAVVTGNCDTRLLTNRLRSCVICAA
jgi:hypothetical protein